MECEGSKFSKMLRGAAANLNKATQRRLHISHLVLMANFKNQVGCCWAIIGGDNMTFKGTLGMCRFWKQNLLCNGKNLHCPQCSDVALVPPGLFHMESSETFSLEHSWCLVKCKPLHTLKMSLVVSGCRCCCDCVSGIVSGVTMLTSCWQGASYRWSLTRL